MALQATYKQFLAAPNSSLLASDASLHYITTLTSLNGSPEIIKHLKSQDLDLKKKEEKILDVVEGPNSIAAEIHTTIEFVNGGGAYLPKLDDNFLADRVVNFPVIHIVSFDGDGKILQVRQSWDQGSLLKSIDVIGKTGRNWPIRDGNDQAKLIANSAKAVGKPSDDAQDNGGIRRARENSNNVTRDPHASLSLFAPREKVNAEALPAAVAPRASAKPPPRDYNELFVGNESDRSPSSPSRAFASPPQSVVAPKFGAGKNYAPSRLFDVEGDDEVGESPNKPLNPKKYQHFTFADGSDPQDAPIPTPSKGAKGKHGTTWDFEHFTTPAKPVPSKVLRPSNDRHWGPNEDDITETPVVFKRVDKPRKDAQTHFEFQDDGTPEEQRRIVGRPRGAGTNTGMGLYTNNLYDDEESGHIRAEHKPSTNLANVKDRRKDFDPHFVLTDDSPIGKAGSHHVGETRSKAVKMMDANWSAYDQSPNQKENVPLSPTTTRPGSKGPLSETTNVPIHAGKGISIAGDGMGGRKAPVDASNAAQKGINIAGDGMGGRRVPLEAGISGQKGINIGGDGMGGKKGSGRGWGIGDESDVEEETSNSKPSKYRTGKTAGKVQSTGGDFWDF
ncbi:hypothetical protein B0O99DRAFT_662498 [Bisporella sp. PMI_857]|nr:hypothetical protein B0O99DRAFT_662498 [Bisporella sp. PMI_857]